MIDVRVLSQDDITAHLDEIAALRSTVFRSWPYLYDGNPDHERQYIASYRDNPGTLLVGALEGGRIVGASTSTPMEDVSADFAVPFREHGIESHQVLWGPESALLPDWRGRGIGHEFFALREAHARGLGRTHVAFASVLRPVTHPARPAGARTNDAFWQRQGYAPMPGVTVEFAWTDVGDAGETTKQLQVWWRAL